VRIDGLDNSRHTGTDRSTSNRVLRDRVDGVGVAIDNNGFDVRRAVELGDVLE
jgi:hypothetical protein